MKRICYQCKGIFKQGCGLCHGQGFVSSNHPGSVGNSSRKATRAKTPKYIKERRQANEGIAKS